MRRKTLAAFLLASVPLAGESSTLLVANKREATLTFIDAERGIVRAAVPLNSVRTELSAQRLRKRPHRVDTVAEIHAFRLPSSRGRA